MFRAIHTAALLLPLALLLGGCSTMLEKPGDPAYAPVQPQPAAPLEHNNGAIYQAGHGMALFEDLRARQVGDILTVTLAEKTAATKSSSNSIGKDSATDIANPKILGRQGWGDLETSLSSSSTFDGSADASQSNKLDGSITVTVAEVLANGNLRVQGEKWVGINDGEEFVRLRGIVRPADIQPDNTVLSTRVADARIDYRGKGAGADANVAGWLTRFFLSPIWPF